MKKPMATRNKKSNNSFFDRHAWLVIAFLMFLIMSVDSIVEFIL